MDTNTQALTSVAELARLLGVRPATVLGQIRQGTVAITPIVVRKPARPGGRPRYAFRTTEVRALLGLEVTP